MCSCVGKGEYSASISVILASLPQCYTILQKPFEYDDLGLKKYFSLLLMLNIVALNIFVANFDILPFKSLGEIRLNLIKYKLINTFIQQGHTKLINNWQ